jgi:alkylation response protein AidB-like acyl-CoA dehydrogenase
MDLDLTEDQKAIKEVFSGFFTNESPPSVARAAEPFGFDRALWNRLLETGAPGMGVSEAHGGGGASLGDLLVVAEELGRAIAPVPLVEHLIAARLFPADDIVSGESIATLALHPADAAGTWSIVPAGAIADVVIGVDGNEVVAVRSAAPLSGPRNHAAAPLADRSARAGERVVLGPAAEFSRAVAEWQTVTSAALVGIAAQALDIALEYVMARQQFGVPIGSFQAIQQGMADLPILIDGGRLLTFKAAWAGDLGKPGVTDADDSNISDFEALASMAFIFTSDGATLATDRSLHYHGGYGFAEEYDIQLFYRRARGWALVYSDPSREAVRLADRHIPEVTH